MKPTTRLFTRSCRECKREFRFSVPTIAYENYMEGEFIQRALPMLTAGERELLITGICDTCFDQITGKLK